MYSLCGVRLMCVMTNHWRSANFCSKKCVYTLQGIELLLNTGKIKPLRFYNVQENIAPRCQK